MSKPASTGDLNDLHATVAKALSTRIKQDIEDNLPTDAATLGAAIKFLKDNNISADPADAENLSGLREQLAEQRRRRQESRSNVIELAGKDLQANGG